MLNQTRRKSSATDPEDILRFANDLNVPPTSNDAERGLRPSKIQQKISGRLSSITRTQDRYRIQGYLNTATKHWSGAPFYVPTRTETMIRSGDVNTPGERVAVG
jgi:Transposase IS66 family